MTYWPISSPSVFAATKETKTKATPVSHDGTKGADDATDSSGTESEQRTERDVFARPQAGAGVAETGSTEAQAHPPTPSEGEHLAEEDIAGDILAVKVTRSGHMFATITRSTLTIWQTKARR